MKTLAITRTYCPKVPNAAEPSYYAKKLLNGVLTLVSAFGGVTALVFLIML